MFTGRSDRWGKGILDGAVKTAVKALICGFVVCFAFSMTKFDAQSRAISQQVVRLHILANSDSEEDQQLKLMVRDRVQQMCADIYPADCDKAAAERIIAQRIESITQEAQRVVREQGYDYSVSGELVDMYFTNRVYGNITLPAGKYKALRLKLGSGEGHNWWCVMFPPICISASGADISDVLSDEQTQLVTSGKAEYKFKVYEMYEQLVKAIDEKERK